MTTRSQIAVAAPAHAAAVVTAPAIAAAQHPNSPSVGAYQLSAERVLEWLIARPGVLIATVVILLAVVYMLLTRPRKRA